MAALFGLGLAWCSAARAEEAANWKVFKEPDGLIESFSIAISLSPRGNVWVRHREQDAVSSLEGFSIRTHPAPGGRLYPVVESRAGQVWSLHPEGLAELVRGQWVIHPIAEVRAELASNPLRAVRPLPILPTEFNHVLVLLTDRLLVCEVGATNSATVLRLSAETRLGKFLDLIESREGGAWVTGERGLARLPKPIRRLDRAAVWEEFLLEAESEPRNLERPFEDDKGGLTLLGDSGSEGKRTIVFWERGQWQTMAPPVERPRAAWRQENGLWVLARNGLWRWRNGQFLPVEREGRLPGQLHDVAVATNGVFWLATSEGVVRYAPQPWQIPEELDSARTSFHSITEDRTGRLWAAAAEGLYSQGAAGWIRENWPSDFDPAFAPADSLHAMADGRLAINGPSGVVLFDPATRGFSRMEHPQSRTIRRVAGQGSDGLVFVFSTAPEGGEFRNQVDAFDGREFRSVMQAGADWGLGDDLTLVALTSDQSLWLAGTLGLASIRRGAFVRYGAEDGWTGGRITGLIEAGQGRLWCGSGGSLLQFDGRRWSVLRTGFERIHAIVRAMDDSIWVAASTGLHRFRGGDWMANEEEDGLASGAVYDLWQDRSGRIWAATSRGLCLHRPEADEDPPRTFLARRELPDEVSTDAGLSLVLRGLDKWKNTAAHRLLFSHRLDAASWSPFASANLLVFPSLSAGPHRLEVRAMDRNWNQEPEATGHEFVAVLPWYQDPRLVGLGIAAGMVILVVTGLAVNRHWRLVRSYAEVERIVTERTRQLEAANRELLHRQKMTALGTMAAGVAHDFNNILSIIKGSAQIIESNPGDTDKVRTRTARIRTVVDQGAVIVKAMLGLTRVAREQLSDCDAGEIALQTVRLLGDRFLQEVRVEVQTDPTIRTFKGAPDLIQQILLNLIINAADSMGGEGRVIVRTGLWQERAGTLALAPAAASEHACIAVEDFGTGIDPEVLPRIFEPFFTTKALSSRRGTGLGLSMVYEISKQLGYGLHLQSEPGRGSTFALLIPLNSQKLAE